jgi:YVTN family beta-propeller protein
MAARMKSKPFLIPVFLMLACAVCGAQALPAVSLRVFPANASLSVDGSGIAPGAGGLLPPEIRLPAGTHRFLISGKGYITREVLVDVPAVKVLEAKLERTRTSLVRIGDFATGIQPKSVEFTPDGRFIICALLEGNGADVLDAATLRKVTALSPPEKYAVKRGFVEIAFAPARGEVWISQMTTGLLHVFRLSDWEYTGSVPTRGAWTKVILISPDENTVYASNWISEDISVIDARTRKVTAKIGVGGIPRGMVLSADGAFLYVCIYEHGQIVKIDTAGNEVAKTLTYGWGAMRHIVRHPEDGTLYVSDMARARVLVIDGATDKKTAEIPVGVNPNTIALTPDGRYLFVSCRGENNPKDYTKKGPEFGKVYCIDTRTNTVVDWTWGGNQPTGLCVSPDGKAVVFTDFLDLRAEVYGFDPLLLP